METMDFSNRSNKIRKNQQQKSQQQPIQAKQSLPLTSTTIKIPQTYSSIATSTPTTTTTTTSTPNTLVIPLKTHSLNHASVEIQKSIEIEASSLQSLEDVETISDESQNIQVTQERDEHTTTQRNTLVDLVNNDGFATSPRGNLLNEQSEKTYRGKTAQELEKLYESSKTSNEYYGKSAESKKNNNGYNDQRSRFQTYVLSDVTPQSFKPPAIIKSAQRNNRKEEAEEAADASLPFVSSATSSSTTQRYIASPEPKPFQYSLQTGANGFSLRAENHPLIYSDEDNSLPQYERLQKTQIFTTTTSKTTEPTTKATTSTTTTTNKPYLPSTARTIATFYAEEILPTTYAPTLRNWRTTRPTPKTSTKKDEESKVENKSQRTFTATSTSSNPSHHRIFSSTSERPIQSFTARATVFKDNLTKTTGPPAHRFVSPYKSLETILSEKEERFGANNLRTTSKPRYTSPASTATPFLATSKQPLRSYFIITSAPKSLSEAIATMSTNLRNFSISDISDAVLTTLAGTTTEVPAFTKTIYQIIRSTTPLTTTTSTTTTESTTPSTTSTASSTRSEVLFYTSPAIRNKQRDASSLEAGRQRGRSRYTAITQTQAPNTDEPTTYAPKYRFQVQTQESTSPTAIKAYRRKIQRARIGNQRYSHNADKSKEEKYQSYKAQQSLFSKSLNRKPIENESTISDGPRAEALVAFPLDNKQDNSIDDSRIESAQDSSSSTEQVVAITDRPLKYFYSNKYRQQTAEHDLAEGLQNAGYITSSTGRSKFRPKSVLEQLQLFLAGESEESDSAQQFDTFTQPEIKAAVEEIKNLYSSTTTTTTLRPTTTASPITKAYVTASTSSIPSSSFSISHAIPSTTETTTTYSGNTNSTHNTFSQYTPSSTTPSTITSTTIKTPLLMPMRASRVNNAIKSSIAAAAASSSNSQATSATSMGRSHKVINGLSSSSSSSLASNSNVAAAVKCSDSTSNAKCNEIPSRYILNCFCFLKIN